MEITIYGKYENGKFSDCLNVEKTESCPDEICVRLPDDCAFLGTERNIWNGKYYLTIEGPASLVYQPYSFPIRMNIFPYIGNKKLILYTNLANPNVTPQCGKFVTVLSINGKPFQ